MTQIPMEVQAWAARAVGRRSKVTEVCALNGGPLLLIVQTPTGTTKVVLRMAYADDGPRLVTEAAALVAAEDRGVPAPRLIAHDPVGGGTGGLVTVLSTFVPGTSAIAREPDESRLRAMGRAVGALAASPASPSPGLPRRHRSLADVEFDHSASGLLTEAAAVLRASPAPVGPDVFVHGDLWLGNTLWQDERLTALIDWDSAGVGHPGIDLGAVRCDAAILFGVPAAKWVLAGWQEVAGDPEWLRHYDIVAALSTPADLTWFLPAIHGQGRTDLDADTLIARRDEFLRAALDD